MAAGAAAEIATAHLAVGKMGCAPSGLAETRLGAVDHDKLLKPLTRSSSASCATLSPMDCRACYCRAWHVNAHARGWIGNAAFSSRLCATPRMSSCLLPPPL